MSKQKYGQHFLTDQSALQRIARTVSELKKELNCDTLWEIGPGKGTLTKEIIDEFDHVKLFEIDVTLSIPLQKLEEEHRDLEVVRGDVLEQAENVSFTPEQKSSTLVVGNLPYYITSPIFRKFFEQKEFPGGVFMIQKEVAEKMASDATKKSYLRWLLNASYQIDVIDTYPPESFSPPPKVSSSLITVKKVPDRLNDDQIDRMKSFLDIITGLKRKTLGKITKLRGEKLTEADLEVSPDLHPKRVEELSREEMRKVVE